MIIGIGHMSPNQLFDETLNRNIKLTTDTVRLVSCIQNLGNALKTGNHVLFFNHPFILDRITPILNLDYHIDSAGEISKKEVIWTHLRNVCFKNKLNTNHSVQKAYSTIEDIITSERKHDLLDKINLLSVILPKKFKRSKIEDLIFNALLKDYDFTPASFAVLLTKFISKKQVLKKEEEESVKLISDWYESDTRVRLAKCIRSLVDNPAWRDSLNNAALEHNVRSFEVGYILSNFERK